MKTEIENDTISKRVAAHGKLGSRKNCCVSGAWAADDLYLSDIFRSYNSGFVSPVRRENYGVYTTSEDERKDIKKVEGTGGVN